MDHLKAACTDVLMRFLENPQCAESVQQQLSNLVSHLRSLSPAPEGAEEAENRPGPARVDLDGIPAWRKLTERYGKLSKFSVIAIVDAVASNCPDLPSLTRQQKRTITALLQFVEQNWAMIEPQLDNIWFTDENFHPVQPEGAEE
jgi:hypothetical protein